MSVSQFMSICKRGLLAAAAVLLFTTCAGAEEYSPVQLLDAGEVSDRFYQNPLPVTDIGDPFIIPANDEYYLFATGGSIGFNVWKSDDLRVYGDKQKALPKLSWAYGSYWAPEVYYYDDHYVMIYTARRKDDKSLRTGIAFSDTPEGPYIDPLDGPLFDLGYATIDANLMVDEDGTPYLFYVRDCSENIVDSRHESHIYGVQLTKDLLEFVGEPVLLTVPDMPWETGADDYRWNEGPYVLFHEGRYYMFYSANYFEDKRYGVGVAVSDEPLGTYVKQENNPILYYVEDSDSVTISGPGHNSLFVAGDELFTAYHTHTYPLAPSGNRQLNIDRTGFHADGTAYISGPTRTTQLLPFHVTGLTNYAYSATGEGIELLTDGDICAAPSSEAYVWRGTDCQFEWDAPCMVDMIVIYPAEQSSAAGRVVINGESAIDFDMASADAEGCVKLYFSPIDITSLRIEFSEDTAVGEIFIVGKNIP